MDTIKSQQARKELRKDQYHFVDKHMDGNKDGQIECDTNVCRRYNLSACRVNILFLFCLCCFMSQVISYGHGGTVSSPNHTFEQAVNQKFVHILSLDTDNSPS